MTTDLNTQANFQPLSDNEATSVDLFLVTQKISLFKNEEEMAAFYHKLALLFCPEALMFSEGSKARLIIYKRKINKLKILLTKVRNFPWHQDIDLIQVGVVHALMYSQLSKKQKSHLNGEWARYLCYMNDVSKHMLFIQNIIDIIVQQKRDLNQLIGQYALTEEEEMLLEESDIQPEEEEKL